LPVSFQALAIECPVSAAFCEDRANAREDAVMASITGQATARDTTAGPKDRVVITFPKKVSLRLRMRKKEPHDRIPATTINRSRLRRRHRLRKLQSQICPLNNNESF
jgi:hypothetical protein